MLGDVIGDFDAGYLRGAFIVGDIKRGEPAGDVKGDFCTIPLVGGDAQRGEPAGDLNGDFCATGYSFGRTSVTYMFCRCRRLPAVGTATVMLPCSLGEFLGLLVIIVGDRHCLGLRLADRDLELAFLDGPAGRAPEKNTRPGERGEAPRL